VPTTYSVVVLAKALGDAHILQESIWPQVRVFRATHSAVIPAQRLRRCRERSRAFARRLEGWPRALAAHPSRLAVKNGEHLRMTAALVSLSADRTRCVHGLARKRRPIHAAGSEAEGVAASGSNSPNNNRQWLWVAACAGTTRRENLVHDLRPARLNDIECRARSVPSRHARDPILIRPLQAAHSRIRIHCDLRTTRRARSDSLCPI
jgi:hypothetical protein